VTCFHDGLNYLTEAGDLAGAFACAYKNLAPGGLFIFDLNAVDWIGPSDDAPVVIEEEDLTIIYRTFHDTGASLWTVEITCFVREGGLYRKFSETHRERGYGRTEVEGMLAGAGFIPLAVYGDFSFDPPQPGGRRHFYAARRP